MKIIPLSETQQKLISSIQLDKRIAAQRESDFTICVLGSNSVNEQDIEGVQLSPDGKAMLVTFKPKPETKTEDQ